jgi:hypothetical protein
MNRRSLHEVYALWSPILIFKVNMYFTCDTLKILMKVSSCETARRSGKAPCKTCKNWEERTTQESNLRSAEEVETPWKERDVSQEPVRFDVRADIDRMHHIGKGRRKHGKRNK